MDPYTEIAKDWLNKRFRECDKHGVYIAHQPIYGFRKDPCEPGYVFRYIITFQIMRMLSHLQFDSLLDVGGAEGYKAFLVQQFFGAKVNTSDLSEEACKRAVEIFQIPAVSADIHELPFEEDEFDVVLCSESLEHVTDYKKAMKELLRVANTAVIVTVPHEYEEIADHNQADESPHGHIHSFDLKSFDYLKEEGYEIFSKKIYSLFSVIPASLLDAKARIHSNKWKHPRIFTNIYNIIVPIIRIFFNNKSVILLLYFDALLCKLFPLYKTNLFVITKNSKNLLNNEKMHIYPKQIIDFQVSHHHLNYESKE